LTTERRCPKILNDSKSFDEGARGSGFASLDREIPDLHRRTVKAPRDCIGEDRIE
jgi:hypothetical protein